MNLKEAQQQLQLADKTNQNSNFIRKDSGKAAILKSQEERPTVQSNRTKYTGLTSQDLNPRYKLVKAQRQRVRHNTADDLAHDETALQVQRDQFSATTAYDLRPDLKPRPFTYRQVFK